MKIDTETLFMSRQDRARYEAAPKHRRPTVWLGLDPMVWAILAFSAAGCLVMYLASA